MMQCDIQIGDGERMDSREGYSLIYMQSDHRFAAPLRDYETTSYAEEAGEHIDARTTEAGFDITYYFCTEVYGRQIANGLHINDRISWINGLLFKGETGSDILTAQQVTIYDTYKHRKITGYPKQKIQEPREDDIFYARGQECAVVGLTLRVDNPKLCDFTSEWEGAKTATQYDRIMINEDDNMMLTAEDDILLGESIK